MSSTEQSILTALRDRLAAVSAENSELLTTSGVARLTYWDGRGNAEVIRMMLEICGQPYEEKTFGSGAKNITSRAEFDVIQQAGVLAFDQIPL